MSRNDQSFSDKELNRSYWFVTHRLGLERLGIGLMVAIVVLLFGVFLYLGLDAFVFKYQAYRQGLRGLSLANQSLSFAQSQQVGIVEQMAIGDTITYNVLQGQVDFITQISNPNQQYKADFEYKYVFGEDSTQWKRVVVLPGQNTYLHFLGYESDVPIRSAEIEFRNFKWENVIDYSRIKNERLNFVIEDAQFNQSVNASDAQGAIPAKVSFTVSNKSAYSYKKVGYIILLYSGNTIAGVQYVQRDNVIAGLQEEIDVASFDALAGISRVDIIPDLNVLDQNNIIGVR